MEHRNPKSLPQANLGPQRDLPAEQTPLANSARTELFSDDELQLQPLETTSVSTTAAKSKTSASPATAVSPAKLGRPPAKSAGPLASTNSGGARPNLTSAAHNQPDDLTAEESDDHQRAGRRRFVWTAAPSWLISMVVHIALILMLAAITLDPMERVMSILQGGTSRAGESIEQFDLQAPQLDSPQSLDESLAIPTSEISEVVAIPELSTALLPVVDKTLNVLDSNRLTESIMPSALLRGGVLSQMTTSLNSRSLASKSEMLEQFGGTAASEKSVANALLWISKHQAPNGGWTFAHSEICHGQCDGQGHLGVATNAATAMALLPFLGAGQTHMEGKYKETVHRGLAFLINRMQVTGGSSPEGSWHEPGGRMYSHGLAAITICEAYAMTRDPDLLQPAQLALNYLIAAQDPRGGGWRYEPGQRGDTSVVGWCVMALKSGRMGNLVVPDATFVGAKKFLDEMSTNKGAYYGYDRPTSKLEGNHSMIAVGLLCRMYMGWPKEHPGLKEGVEYLGKLGPRTNDLYYSYYGTQVMRHYGGPLWEKWNEKLRNELISTQEPKGHAMGSWPAQGAHAEKGGRLYVTSLATMILEVYYRHMPLYSEKSALDDFEI